MLLSDSGWLHYLREKEVEIEPFDVTRLQPASIDLTLANELLYLDGTREHFTEKLLAPHEFVLARTVERVGFSSGFAGRVEGKSSHGRKGLMVHVTAGWIDPGFSGTITLELVNISPVPVKITAGQAICQITAFVLERRAAKPYGHSGLQSKYQNQQAVTESRDA